MQDKIVKLGKKLCMKSEEKKLCELEMDKFKAEYKLIKFLNDEEELKKFKAKVKAEKQRIDNLEQSVLKLKQELLCLKNIQKNTHFIEQHKEEIENSPVVVHDEMQDKIDKLNKSLKNELIWNFCPNTREIASKMASKDVMLAEIIEKTNKNEELDYAEKLILDKYYKNVWLKAGYSELKKAILKADEIMHLAQYFGVKKIEDENARNIVKKFYGNYQAT